MLYRKLILLVLFTALALPRLALAQNEEMTEPMEPPHAGQMRQAGPYYLELVARPSRLTLYVIDRQGNKSEARGSSATAIVSTDKIQYTVKLRPVADNVLRGKGKFVLSRDTEIMIALSMPDHAAVEYAQFQPRQEMSAAELRKTKSNSTSNPRVRKRH